LTGDEVLVKVRCTAVNHLDLVEASGRLKQILPIDLPWIPGHEFSGAVEQIGTDVSAYAPGDAIFGTTSGMGAYAEYLAVAEFADSSSHRARHVPLEGQTR
jgi:NADPH:quinone reductase-like Zn-dependent oxidoreductase